MLKKTGKRESIIFSEKSNLLIKLFIATVQNTKNPYQFENTDLYYGVASELGLITIGFNDRETMTVIELKDFDIKQRISTSDYMALSNLYNRRYREVVEGKINEVGNRIGRKMRFLIIKEQIITVIKGISKLWKN